MNDRPEDELTNELQDERSADLLGAFLLDAVDDVERRRVERELASDPELADEAIRLGRVVDAFAESLADEAASLHHRRGQKLCRLWKRFTAASAPWHDACCMASRSRLAFHDGHADAASRDGTERNWPA